MSKKIMKRSLALGALMAFVITGSAMSVAEAREYIEGKGQPIEVTENRVDSSDRVVGGWDSVPTGTDAPTSIETDVTVTGGKFNVVSGGHWAGNAHAMVVESTKVTINGEAVEVKQFVGGTAFSSPNTDSTSNNVDGRTTTVNIANGSFGFNGVSDTDCPEELVVGGDLLKAHISGGPGTSNTMLSKIDETNVTITGGTFNAAVLGGSSAVRAYAGYVTGDIEATVEKANITITGGTFNEAIAAGGLAWGHETDSIVKETVLTISGESGKLFINSDIYAGGLDGSNGAGYETAVSKVEKATVTIDNATVKDIYGSGGNIEMKEVTPTVFNGDFEWSYKQNTDADAIVNTTLKLTNVTADDVVIPLGSVTLRVEDDENTKGEINIGQSEGKTGLTVTKEGENKVTVSVEANGEVNDAYAGDYNKMVKERFLVNGYDLLKTDETINADAIENFTVEEGEVMGAATLNSDGTITTTANQGNTGIKDIVATGLISWRYEMNDMNKRMGELRNANGEHGVWVRMVRGETEYNSVKNQYNQYQLGYDEKLSVDPSWTVGVALSYTEADNNFSKGTGESTNKALSVYGSKLNDDGTFIDLIAKYARLENDFDLGTAKGDYDTNGYSFSAEYGKRIQQGNGLWIEPQVELTYGQVDGATYMVGGSETDSTGAIPLSSGFSASHGQGGSDRCFVSWYLLIRVHR